MSEGNWKNEFFKKPAAEAGEFIARNLGESLGNHQSIFNEPRGAGQSENGSVPLTADEREARLAMEARGLAMREYEHEFRTRLSGVAANAVRIQRFKYIGIGFCLGAVSFMVVEWLLSKKGKK